MLEKPPQTRWKPEGFPDEGEEERTLRYSHPEEWLVRWFIPHTRRKLGGNYTWCPEWWRHAEAITRIAAMWMAWEHLRWEGALGLSTFMLDHYDRHLPVLLSKDSGPFSGCRPDRHSPPANLPNVIAPPEIWESSAFSDPERDPS